MKKLASLLFLLIFIGYASFAQSNSAISEMNRFFSKTIKYPSEARMDDLTGIITLSIAFDEAGYPLGEPEIYGEGESLSEEVLRNYELIKDNWNPEILEGKNPGEEYLMSFQFILQKGKDLVSNPLTKYKKEVPADPLEKLNKAIEKNPVSSKLYMDRSEYYAMIGENWKSKLDYNQAQYLKDKEITNIVIVGYGGTNSPKSL
ncbi:hypothetical protein JYB64_03875 [Algoriphagus aestuarii]|nr:hypothetical protein [Algoriphagus aestuarii]